MRLVHFLPMPELAPVTSTACCDGLDVSCTWPRARATARERVSSAIATWRIGGIPSSRLMPESMRYVECLQGVDVAHHCSGTRVVSGDREPTLAMRLDNLHAAGIASEFCN